MIFTNIIRGIVKKNPQIKLKIKKANSKQTPFQYLYQTITMTIMSSIAFFIIAFMITKNNPLHLLIGILFVFMMIPFLYRFWFSYIDVQIRKTARELDGDLLFVSEYFLVSLESGLPLGNAIQNLSRLKRPGGRFFKKVYTEFNTGKDLEQALEESANFCASDSMKVLLKKLKDSLNIGIDLRTVLDNFVDDASEKKIIDIRAFSKKLNPTIMMYLLLGVVLPSLGVTFFILAAAILEMTPELLKVILIFIFLLMFGFQYVSYSIFKFSKATL
jgi:Flp pilus assembly protein TadB